jgi:hypothetical protein
MISNKRPIILRTNAYTTTKMTLTTEPCQKFIYVTHTESGIRKPATVKVDGTVVDKDGSFDEDEWEVNTSYMTNPTPA